jgi:hypothetical protein
LELGDAGTSSDGVKNTSVDGSFSTGDGFFSIGDGYVTSEMLGFAPRE